MHRNTLYICAGDTDGVSCPLNDRECFEDCHYTTHPEYALNGPCEDPENHPERFKKVGTKDDYRYEEIRRQ